VCEDPAIPYTAAELQRSVFMSKTRSSWTLSQISLKATAHIERKREAANTNVA
jgi:hypothetical protein